MGYSIGPVFTNDAGIDFYIEASAGQIQIWQCKSAKLLAAFYPEEAQKLADSILLHLQYYSGDE